MLAPWPPNPRAPSSSITAISDAPSAAKKSVPDGDHLLEVGHHLGRLDDRTVLEECRVGVIRVVGTELDELLAQRAGASHSRRHVLGHAGVLGERHGRPRPWSPWGRGRMLETSPMRTSAMNTGAPSAMSATSSKVAVAVSWGDPLRTKLLTRKRPARTAATTTTPAVARRGTR